MVDAAHYAVAILAVSVGYFLRTIVPYMNAKAQEPDLRFEVRYALWGSVLWLVSLWTAFSTIGMMPNMVRGSLAATFLGYLLFAVAGNHVVFEAIDKARGSGPVIA